MRDEIAGLPEDAMQALLAARSLAQAGWDEPDLRLLGRKIRGILTSAVPGFGGQARQQGLVPLRLLILSASTGPMPRTAMSSSRDAVFSMANGPSPAFVAARCATSFTSETTPRA